LSTPADHTTGTYTASSIYGYNQSVGSLDAAAGELIRANSTDNGFKNLQDEVQAIGSFLGLSLTGPTDRAAGNTITAAHWNQLMNDAKTCFDNRFSVPSGSLTTAAHGASSRSTSWGSASEPAIAHTFTVSFSSEAHCRGFFNAGGKILFTGARSGGTSGSSAGTIGSQNSNWTSLLSSMGTLTFDLNNLTSSGSTGSSNGKGFYELTKPSTTLYQVRFWCIRK